jgi:hypothetical protein
MWALYSHQLIIYFSNPTYVCIGRLLDVHHALGNLLNDIICSTPFFILIIQTSCFKLLNNFTFIMNFIIYLILEHQCKN